MNKLFKSLLTKCFVLFLGFSLLAPQVQALSIADVQLLIDNGIIPANKINAAKDLADDADDRPDSEISIIIGGSAEYTVVSGSRLPDITWESDISGSRIKYEIKSSFNDTRKCSGIKKGNLISKVDPSGIYQLSGPRSDKVATIKNEGCDVTYKFKATNSLGEVFEATSILKYRAKTETNRDSPNAAILIGGQSDITIYSGDIIPDIVWNGSNANRFKTILTANDSRLCAGVKTGAGELWSTGNNASGSKTSSDRSATSRVAPRSMEGCDLTFTYSATNTITGEVDTSVAVLKYRAKTVADEKSPTASIKVGGASRFIVETGQVIPDIAWSSRNANVWKTTLSVNSSRLCDGLKNGHVWSRGNTASGDVAIDDRENKRARKSRESCELTFTYEAKNTRTGEVAESSATLIYVPAGSGVTPSSQVAPTASILIGNESSVTIKSGEPTPRIVWQAGNYTSDDIFQTTLGVNDSAKCGGIKNGQVWSQGKNPSGQHYVPAPTVKMEGCELTYTYKVTDRASRQFATASATVTYVSQDSDVSNNSVTASFTIGGKTGVNDPYIAYAGQNYPLFEWSTNANKGSARAVVNSSTLCKRNDWTTTIVGVGKSGRHRSEGKVPANMSGCEVTYTYKAENTLIGGQKEVSAKVIYKAGPPEVKITRTNSRVSSSITAGSTVPYSWSIKNINVPNHLNIYLYSPEHGNVVDINQADSGYPNFAGNDSLTIPADTVPGQYRLSICDHGTDNPQIPGKSLCYHDAFFDVVNSQTTSFNSSMITPTIAEGARGEKVSLVQQALKQAGYFTEEVTGYFGNITKNAVSAFQKANALENVGAVGPKTAELLNRLLGF